MADAWGGAWGSSWGVSWGFSSPTPPPPPPVAHEGGGGSSVGLHYPHYLEEVRHRLARAEEARDRTIKEQKAATKQLRKALERAYHGIAEDAPEEAERFAAIAAPRTVKIDAAKFLPTAPSIDWTAFAADLDRVSRLLNEMERQRAETETKRAADAARLADEDDLEMLLLAL